MRGSYYDICNAECEMMNKYSEFRRAQYAYEDAVKLFKKSFEKKEAYFALAVNGEKTMDQVTPEERKELIKKGKELSKTSKEVK